MLAIMYGFGRCREGRLAETLFNEVFTQTSIMEMLRNFWSVSCVTRVSSSDFCLFHESRTGRSSM